MQRLIKLSAPNVLLVKGPASVKCAGSVSVLGMDACTKEVMVRAGKILPFEASQSSQVKIRLGKGGNYRLVGESKVGVSIWKEVASRITLQNKPMRIMIVGATDTGKSTLATYLSNIASANKLKVSIVDGDVGQSDLAPPGCIGASMIREEFLDLRDISVEYSSFIGSLQFSNAKAGVGTSDDDEGYAGEDGLLDIPRIFREAIIPVDVPYLIPEYQETNYGNPVHQQKVIAMVRDLQRT